jgi:lysophospholipase L1-like esterase
MFMCVLKNNLHKALIALIFAFGNLPAQTVTPAAAKTYSFINYNENYLHHSKDSSIMLAFYKKIDDLREGKRDKVTIVHYGGSHIQAGTWSDKLIVNFQAYGNFEGGGLFCFPYKIAKTNSPSYFKSFTTGKWKRYRCATWKEMCVNLGMAGIAAVTNDSSNTFGVKLNKNGHHEKFNSLKIYHNFNPSFQFSLTPMESKYIRRDEPDKGYSLFEFEQYIDSVNFSLVKLDTMRIDFMLEGFSLDNTKPGFYYAGFGVNGAASNSYLKCNLFGQQLESVKPDLVILSLGVNDTQGKDFTKNDYIEHYDSLITEIRNVSPDCAILLTTTTDNYIKRRTANKRPIKAQDAMFELMEKHHAAVWDLYSVMGGYKSIAKWYKVGLAARDKVHFSPRGYGIVGQMMFDAFDKSYKANSKLK